MADDGANGWYVWSKHVLLQLEKDTVCLAEIKKEQTMIRIEIAKLKVKSGVWGAIGGAVPFVVALIIWLIRTS